MLLFKLSEIGISKKVNELSLMNIKVFRYLLMIFFLAYFEFNFLSKFVISNWIPFFTSITYRKWAKWLFCTCPLQYRYHLLCVISGLTVVLLFLANYIDFGARIDRRHAQKCVEQSEITLNPIACYLPKCETNTSLDEGASFGDIVLFEDVLEAERKPTPDRTIFFIVTSCTKLAVLSARWLIQIILILQKNENIFVL